MLHLVEKLTAEEPTANLEIRFHGMLDMYKQSTHEGKRSWGNLLNDFIRNRYWRPVHQLTYGVVLLISGIAIGFLLFYKAPQDNNKAELIALSSQMQEMRQMMMLSLLENPSATERLRGVSYTKDISKVNTQVIEALLKTLNEDPNVNVRLVALDALVKYSDQPLVREELVVSIVNQQSPLVQSALADVMMKLQEKRSVKEFKELLEKTEAANPIRSKIEKTIAQLSL